MKTTIVLLLAILFNTSIFAQKQRNSEKYQFPNETRDFLKVAYPGISTGFIIDESKVESGKKYLKERYLTSFKDKNGKSYVDEAIIEEGDILLAYDKKPWINVTTGQLLIRDMATAGRTAHNGRVRDGQGLERVMTVGGVLLNVGGQIMDRVDRRNGGYYGGGYSSGGYRGVQTVNMGY